MDMDENQSPTFMMWCHYDPNYGLQAFCSCGWKAEHARQKIVRQKMERHYAKTGHVIKGPLKTG